MLLALLVATPVLANERRFAYTYETPTLPEGAVEIEPWVTLVQPGDATGLQFRHRLEFELGVTNRLMTALYLNWFATTSGFTWSGVSSEWKYNVTSRAVAPVGLSLYGEASIGPQEWELEGKLLFDVERGPFLATLNLVGEYEALRELSLANDGTLSASWAGVWLVQSYLGVSYELPVKLAPGAEFRSSSRILEAQTSLAAGPSLAYRTSGWWATMSFLPRITTIAPAGATLIDDQAWEYRLLLGFHL